MKKLIVILIVLFASSVVFAGGAQWWKCTAFLENSFMKCTVCATDLHSAGMEAMAAGLCGYKNPAKRKAIVACINSAKCQETHVPCVP